MFPSISFVPRSGTIILTTLLCALRRAHCLPINVQRDSIIRMSQNLLDGLDVLIVILQQGAEVVAESVPIDVLVNTGFAYRRSASSLDCPASRAAAF